MIVKIYYLLLKWLLFIFIWFKLKRLSLPKLKPVKKGTIIIHEILNSRLQQQQANSDDKFVIIFYLISWKKKKKNIKKKKKKKK